jgi:CRP/FNR family transcriptional regulator
VIKVTQSKGRVALRDELVLGRQELSARFHNSAPRTFERGELLIAAHSENVIYHLIAGWACKPHEFLDSYRAIVDIYLPGDVVGLDAVLRSRPSEGVMTLTSLVVEAIEANDTLVDLMDRRSTALYVAWLLSQRQQRLDRLLAAISSLDARGRVATMLLDFYVRLHRQRLITGSTYNLPLTQIQIGAYLGLTVAHVNRVLRTLRDERVVSLEKHLVTIIDIDRLRRLTENSPRATPDIRSSDEPLATSGLLTRIRVDPSQPDPQVATVDSVPVPVAWTAPSSNRQVRPA